MRDSRSCKEVQIPSPTSCSPIEKSGGEDRGRGRSCVEGEVIGFYIPALARIEAKKVRDKSFDCHRITKEVQVY